MQDQEIENEGTGYSYRVELTREVAFLVFLSTVYKLDLEYLLHLYDRVGEDLFFFFMLFAGKQVVVPRKNKLMKILKFSHDAVEALRKGEEVEISTNQERDVLDELRKMLVSTSDDSPSLVVNVSMEIPHVIPRSSTYKVVPPSEEHLPVGFDVAGDEGSDPD